MGSPGQPQPWWKSFLFGSVPVIVVWCILYHFVIKHLADWVVIAGGIVMILIAFGIGYVLSVKDLRKRSQENE